MPIKERPPQGEPFLYWQSVLTRSKPERMSTGRGRGGRNPYQLHRAEPAQSVTRKTAKFKKGIDPLAGSAAKSISEICTRQGGSAAANRKKMRKHTNEKKTAAPNRQAGATVKPETQRRSISGKVILHDAGSRCKRERPAERNFS